MSAVPRRLLAVVLCLFSVSIAAAQGRIAIPASSTMAVDVAMGEVQREVVYEGIAHYSWVVKVGPGAHDLIRLHRVVKEVRPHHPAALDQAVMFFPGSPTYFEGLYLVPKISDVPARDRAIAIFLAKNGIDVWGIDYRWALVPEETTDFCFMKKWGSSQDVEDAQVALTLARWIRGGWAKPDEPFFVGGLSYGGMMSYAVAANDTQRPRRFRNVKGIIPLDYGVKFDVPGYKAEACANVDAFRALHKSGVYADDNRWMWSIGQLAIDDPHGASPFQEGVTNYQFGLEAGTFPSDEFIPWHFVGGYFDPATGLPTGLRFTEDRLLFDLFLRNEPPYFPVQADIEGAIVECDRPHVGPTYADHLDKVAVPILYIGAAGGIGHAGEYTTTLTASTDVTILIVQRLADGQRAEDFGHADLLTAVDAEQWVWRPTLDWIKAHR